ncbi:MAG: DUF2851 family protein [Cyclobacteriaceae bacterium]|nr:DUF2851 family protein [Cyclobacteriaceae bacterium]
MREQFLHFIWAHQNYKKPEAFTQSHLPILVIKQGKPHANSGPDFGQAKIKIEHVEWNGDVEIHVKSSDWDVHGHQFDKAYNKVVLHVVWKHDKEVKRQDGTQLPTLVLEPLVAQSTIDRANSLLNTLASIPCEDQLKSVPKILVINEIQRAFIKRLERKGAIITEELANTKGDWDEVAYRFFMKQMGMKVNGEVFYELALVVPFSMIRKYSHSVFQLEALLFGASGMLNTSHQDDYMKELRQEYDFLAHKHKITKFLNAEMWKFLRLRPSNFPTLRLAQAAAILAKSTSIFIFFTEKPSVLNGLKLEVSTYWKTHYKFKTVASNQVPILGKASIDLLLINVVAPLLTAYSKSLDDDLYIEKALTLLAKVKPEKNVIIRTWKELKVEAKNAGESQGLIELYNESCLQKKCLTCGIGFSLIREK